MRLRAVITAIAAGLMALSWCAAARAAEPDEAVRAHFAAIQSEDYTGADSYFSSDFLDAFKADVEALNAYYNTRREQLAAGYTVVSVEPLADTERETARVTIDFNDPREDALRTVTERINYYLIRQKAPDGAPGRDAAGRAWRIDIYDAISFDTLADARRRAYLGTKQAWAEDEGRELRSKQGFFRIQWALTSFFEAKGRYPLRLLGGDNRRDELISGGQLAGSYPTNGFNNEPMKLQDFGEKSSGDYSYYSLDNDGDGKPDDYWLLLHGKVSTNYYYEGHDTVYVANGEMDGSQAELAQRFADFWFERNGNELTLTAAVEPGMPGSALLPTQGMQEVLADARATQLTVQPYGDFNGPGQPPSEPAPAPGATERAAASMLQGGPGDDPAAMDIELDESIPAESAASVDAPADQGDTAHGEPGTAVPELALLDDPQLTVIDEFVETAAGETVEPGENGKPDAEATPFEWLFSNQPGVPWRIFSFGWD